MVLTLAACGQSGTTWQEQYDLGIRYLKEGNYQEAILAFTAAIEIDANRTEAYLGRAKAYVSSGNTEENRSNAKADYETVIELDAEGNCISKMIYYTDGSVNIYNYYEYDDHGNILRYTSYKPDGTCHIYEYQSNGNLLSHRTDYPDGRSGIAEFNTEGIMIRHTLYHADGTTIVTE